MLQVERQQWLRPAELRKLQDAKLRAMVRHAYANVPFYRRAWKAAGVRPEDVRGAEDMRKLPIITRRDIRANHDDFIATGIDRATCHMESTSGSSGMPLEVLFDSDAFDYIEAVYARALFAAGYRPWHRLAYVWFPPFKKMKLYEHLGIMKKSYIPSIANERTQLDIMVKINPEVIYSFPTTLFLIAKLIRQRGIDSIRPKVVISHAELLSEKFKEFFKDVFGCDVYNQYGSTEFDRMGWDCSLHNGFHVDSDSILVELLKGNEPAAAGERSDVVVTGLANRAMPLIRYAIGDIGVPSGEDCACGRGLPLMNLVEGRADDFIVLPSGRAVGPRNILNSMYEVLLHNDELLRVKVTQLREDKLRVDVVQGAALTGETLRKLKNVLLSTLGEPVDVEINTVDNIPKNSHGKLRAVESKIKLRP